jgi:hypothetical protein
MRMRLTWGLQTAIPEEVGRLGQMPSDMTAMAWPESARWQESQWVWAAWGFREQAKLPVSRFQNMGRTGRRRARSIDRP